jgi:hypothetical protein
MTLAIIWPPDAYAIDFLSMEAAQMHGNVRHYHEKHV